jgi:trehalose 6-phosphate synthase
VGRLAAVSPSPAEPDRSIVIASNRGPAQFEPNEDGDLVPQRGGGGLVTALTGALAKTGGLWVAAAMSDGDRQMANESPDGRIEMADEDTKYDLRYLSVPPDRFDRYYNVVSNRILWFTYHYLFDAPRTPRFGRPTERAWKDYVAVNRSFADALVAEDARPARSPAHLIQDYHLSLVPAMLRRRRPGALVAHFTHTPFAGPDYFRILPTQMADAVLRGLLGSDVVGFHSEAWAENFLLCCRHLQGARVDLRTRRVDLDGRRTLVRVYPIAIDVEGLRRAASSPEVRRVRRELIRWLGGRKLILRVDRTELSKNILRGFLAYEAFLKRRPQWRDRVRFLTLLNPSRRGIPEYRAYTRDCLRTAERINQELGTPDWRPIDVIIRDDFVRAVAGYSLYDVLMVNPVFDGMNLVAMEGPTVNRTGGVLVLSRNAGAHSLLGRHAVSVNPFDIAETADAIASALVMPEEERAVRARSLRRIVASNPPSRWVNRQLGDVEEAATRRR